MTAADHDELAADVRLLTGVDYWTLPAAPERGIRSLVTSDGPAGVRGPRWDEREPSINVPCPSALGATWNPDAVARIGDLLAAECRRKGVDVLLAPMVNLQRSPYGGRAFEMLSEDPLLTAEIGSAMVTGLQRAGVGATIKAYVANDSETDRFSYDVCVDERALHELYLAAFEMIVRRSRPWTVMAAYNAVQGTTMSESPLLVSPLRDEWGFDGLVMSDWYGVRTTVASARGGLDLVMPGPDGPWGDALVQAVHRGEVPRAAVEAKVANVVKLAERVGARKGVAGAGERAPGTWPPEKVAEALRETAAASFVLAHNGNLLPLHAHALGSVALLGPAARAGRIQGGGSAAVMPTYAVGPLAGLRAALGDERVHHAEGVRASERLQVAPETALCEPGGGMIVSVRARDGRELVRERRHAAGLIWLGMIADGIRVGDVDEVRVSTRLRAEETGEHMIGASGVGRIALALDGVERFDAPLSLPPSSGLGEWTLRPPQRGVAVELVAGQEIAVRLSFWPEGSGDSSVDIAELGLQLNFEPPRGSPEAELARAEALARENDVAVVVVGTTEETESEGFDRESLALPGPQDELVRRVARANPRTIVVVNAGAPVLMPWADEVAAVLLTWFPGQEFGHALADVLLGRREPSGRLPTGWPRTGDRLPSVMPVDGRLSYREGLRLGYRAGGDGMRYPFGHGLGYGRWEYRELRVEGERAVVHLVNTGERSAREVVQIYAERPDSSVPRPVRWLVGFAATTLAPGADAWVEVPLAPRGFAHWDAVTHGFVIEPGRYRLRAGRSSADLRLTGACER